MKLIEDEMMTVRVNKEKMKEFSLNCEDAGINRSLAIHWFMHEVNCGRIVLNGDEIKTSLRAE